MKGLRPSLAASGTHVEIAALGLVDGQGVGEFEVLVTWLPEYGKSRPGCVEYRPHPGSALVVLTTSPISPLAT